ATAVLSCWKSCRADCVVSTTIATGYCAGDALSVSHSAPPSWTMKSSAVMPPTGSPSLSATLASTKRLAGACTAAAKLRTVEKIATTEDTKDTEVKTQTGLFLRVLCGGDFVIDSASPGR